MKLSRPGRHLPAVLWHTTRVRGGGGGGGNLVPKNNDNTLGCERAGIIAVHYVCSIYTTSHSPTAADG